MEITASQAALLPVAKMQPQMCLGALCSMNARQGHSSIAQWVLRDVFSRNDYLDLRCDMPRDSGAADGYCD